MIQFYAVDLISEESSAPGFFSMLQRQFGKFRNPEIIPKNVSTLLPDDVSRVITCLSSECKTALQHRRDKDLTMLRFILPHLKESVEVMTLSRKCFIAFSFRPSHKVASLKK